MKVRYTYRLRPGRTALRRLSAEWDLCRYVWNEMVAQSRAIRDARESIALAGAEPVTFGPAQADKLLSHLRATKVDADGTKWLAKGSSVAQQQTVRDFAAARSKAIADRANAVPHHLRRRDPRFRKKDTSSPTLNYTRNGFSIRADSTGAKRLILAGGISIPVVFSRDLPSDPSSVRISRDSLGHWEASFVVESDAPPLPAPREERALGVDWGVSEIATTVSIDMVTGEIDESAAYDLPHAQHRRQAQAELVSAQRAVSRRKPERGSPASKGYLRAKRKAAKAHKRVLNQRKDAARKWARRAVRDHSHLAIEDFRPKFLASTTMAAKAADGAIAATKAELIWQAAKSGRVLKLVNPAHTTMDCSNCGARAKHRLPLGQRTYACQACGFVRPRDKNSAAVMVARAGFNPADADRRRPGGLTPVGQRESGIPRL